MKLTPLLVALVLLPVVGVGAEPARSVFSLVDEVTELFPDTRLDEPVRRLVVQIRVLEYPLPEQYWKHFPLFSDDDDMEIR